MTENTNQHQNKDLFQSYDRMVFLKKLEEYSVIFRSVYELGNAQYSNSVDTACVAKNVHGELCYLLNYDFFWSLNETEQLFLICHESLHLFFNHLNHIEKYQLNPTIANIAMDIVINETLVQHFNFNRINMPTLTQGCFIDTVFDTATINKYTLNLSKGYQYFYDIIKAEIKNNNQYTKEKVKDYHKNGGMDEHNKFTQSSTDDKKESSDKSNPSSSSQQNNNNNPQDDESNANHKTQNDSSEQTANNQKSQSSNNEENNNDSSTSQLKDNGQQDSESQFQDIDEELIKNIIEDVENMTDTNLDDFETKVQIANAQHQGNYDLQELLKDKEKKEIIKIKEKKWKKLVKWVNPSLLDLIDIEEPSFGKEAAPFLFSLDSNMLMPGVMETQDYGKFRIDLYFFFDVSGSCINHLDQFVDIVSHIPRTLFNPHLFTFDTKVKEVEMDWKSKKITSTIKVGGGTAFHILENQIQSDLKNKIIKRYPEFVCVLTDGMAMPITNIPANKQKNWLWLLINNDGGTNASQFNKQQWELIKKIIPFHDNEFDINKPKINTKIKDGCKLYPINHLK